MSRRKKIMRLISAFLTAVTFVPLTIAAVCNVMPEPEEALIFATDMSVRLTVGGMPQESAGEVASEKAAADEPEAVYAEKKLIITIDDSNMLSYGELNIPSGENEELTVEDGTYDVGPEPYPEKLESRDGIITAVRYERFAGEQYINLSGGAQIRNVTAVANDELEAAACDDYSPTAEKNGLPQVLIMHTHTTESFEPYERDFYDSSFNSRTTDESMNITAVGRKIAEKLEEAGIGVIHDTTLHDYPSYNGSYDRSRETVTKILEENPSVKYVLDIHRDAIEREGGERIAPSTDINGKSCAQVMIICGCDDGTMGMPDYMENFRFAARFQEQLEADFPTLTRPVLFDYRKYNQDLTTGSLLVEVGGHANSIDQVLNSGEMIGESLAKLLS